MLPRPAPRDQRLCMAKPAKGDSWSYFCFLRNEYDYLNVDGLTGNIMLLFNWSYCPPLRAKRTKSYVTSRTAVSEAIRDGLQVHTCTLKPSCPRRSDASPDFQSIDHLVVNSPSVWSMSRETWVTAHLCTRPRGTAATTLYMQ